MRINTLTIKNHEGSRTFFVFNGMPLYISSGTNSGHTDTCFPTRGHVPDGSEIAQYKVEKPGEEIVNPADKRKPTTTWSGGDWDTIQSAGEEVSKILDKPHTGSGDTLRVRFASLPCMLISAKVGGGFWNTEDGKKLLSSVLENDTCGNFYNSLPDFEFDNDKQIEIKKDDDYTKFETTVNGFLNEEIAICRERIKNPENDSYENGVVDESDENLENEMDESNQGYKFNINKEYCLRFADSFDSYYEISEICNAYAAQKNKNNTIEEDVSSFSKGP